MWSRIEREIQVEVRRAENELVNNNDNNNKRQFRFAEMTSRRGNEVSDSVRDELSLMERMCAEMEEMSPNVTISRSEDAHDVQSSINSLTNSILEQIDNPTLRRSIRQEMEGIKRETLLKFGVKRGSTDDSELKVEWYILCELMKELFNHVQRKSF